MIIAFYFLAPEGKEWSINQIFVVGLDNYTFKFIVAILITPLIYFAHYLIDSYLGKSLSTKAKNIALNNDHASKKSTENEIFLYTMNR